MKLIDIQLLDDVSRLAQKSDRLRMNYNFHQSLEDKCHHILTPSTSVTTRQSTSKLALRSLFRRLNAVEPGTDIPIHKHPDKDESFVILRGKVRSTTYNDDGSVIDSVVLSHEDGIYGVDIPKGVWHKLESLAPASVIFECKQGPFVPHDLFVRASAENTSFLCRATEK